MKALTATIFATTIAFAGSFYDCVRNAIDIERAVEIARPQVGTPFKAWVSQSKRTGECFWKVKGTQGYVIMEADSGEVIRFYKNRK